MSASTLVTAGPSRWSDQHDMLAAVAATSQRTMRGIHDKKITEKKLVFGPFTGAPRAIAPKIL